MNRRYHCAALFIFAASLAGAWFARPAQAITFGEIDADNRFTSVGAIVVVADPGNPAIAGSGVLIHPRVLLTAGHVTAGAQAAIDLGLINLEDGRISLATDAFDPSTWREIEAIITHPGFYTPSQEQLHDVGVVVLKEPVDLPCASLAYTGLLDDLKDAGLLVNFGSPERFLTVGYGATLEFPPPALIPSDGLRRFVFSDFRALRPGWLVLNENPNTENGGGAPGDSGGPVFWIAPNGELVVVALHARGNAVSLTEAYRLDSNEAQDFINFVLAGVEGK